MSGPAPGVEVWHQDGHPCFAHDCVEGREYTALPLSPPHWRVVSVEPLTVEPFGQLHRLRTARLDHERRVLDVTNCYEKPSVVILREARVEQRLHPDWRWGQTVFNCTQRLFPDLAAELRGSKIDPFYVTERVTAALQWLDDVAANS